VAKTNAERQADYRERRKLGLRKGRTPAPNEQPRAKAAPRGAALAPGTTVVPKDEPTLTADTARELAKLLAAGLPQLKAMAYVAPAYFLSARKWQLPKWRARWMNSPLLLDAVRTLNGASWTDLDPKRRLEISLDKHYAELAYYLYHHDFARLTGEDLDKAKIARGALVEKLSEGKAGDDAPFAVFMRELMADKVKGHIPAQLTDNDLAGVALPVATRRKES
jgi:hypothetical protein